jgi:hypothetical protein
MNFKDEERRFKTFSISRKQLLQLITGEIQIQNIPEWSTILEIQSNFQTRGWDFLIYHPSFPEVKEGEMSESINLIFEKFNRGKRKLTFK